MHIFWSALKVRRYRPDRGVEWTGGSSVQRLTAVAAAASPEFEVSAITTNTV